VAGELLYLDSSALVKLVQTEDESAALVRHLVDWPRRITSVASRVEVLRAARRAGGEVAVERARALLEHVALLELDGAVTAAAGAVEPARLGSLDAIHLGSALSLGEDLGGFVVYDLALADAARTAGLPVVVPR
jgi:predicted nucleic acid-binding protein